MHKKKQQKNNKNSLQTYPTYACCEIKSSDYILRWKVSYAFSTIKSPIDAGNFSNTLQLFRKREFWWSWHDMHCHKYHSSSFRTHDEWEWWHQSIHNSKKKFYKHMMHAWRSKIGISIIYIQIESYNIDIINAQFPMKLSLLVLPIMLVTLNLNRYLTLKFWCFFGYWWKM